MIMEPVVYEETPLASYLRGWLSTSPSIRMRCEAKANRTADGGEFSEEEWAADQSIRPLSSSSDGSLPPSPTPFAPTGRPTVRAQFRHDKNLGLPRLQTTRAPSFQSLKKSYSVWTGHLRTVLGAAARPGAAGRDRAC